MPNGPNHHFWTFCFLGAIPFSGICPFDFLWIMEYIIEMSLPKEGVMVRYRQNICHIRKL
jgi:hypothetical protein